MCVRQLLKIYLQYYYFIKFYFNTFTNNFGILFNDHEPLVNGIIYYFILLLLILCIIIINIMYYYYYYYHYYYFYYYYYFMLITLLFSKLWNLIILFSRRTRKFRGGSFAVRTKENEEKYK